MNQESGLATVTSQVKKDLVALGANPGTAVLKEIASLIVRSMSNPNRFFHAPTHALDLIGQDHDPIMSLAALFHDIVYYQVDEGFPALAGKFLKSVVRVDQSGIVLSENSLRDRPDLAMVCAIFDMKPGQVLNPINGQNEFLSALVAHETLQRLLTAQILVQIYACIEATIPFRSKHGGRDPIVELEKSLRACNSKFNLNLPEATQIATMKRAVELANRDVKNFSSPDVSWFLATTWLLLPERNPSLRGDSFTIKEYRVGLQKMEDFFNFLSADLVFKQYRGFPDDVEHAARTKSAADNIASARGYLKAKIAAIGLIEALASETGGDLQIATFLGKIRRADKGHRMEDLLPRPAKSAPHQPALLSLLQKGRAFEATFDLQNSPLAAFVYRQIGDKGLDSLMPVTKQFFAGEITSSEYLKYVPGFILSPIADACARICLSRAEALNSLPLELPVGFKKTGT